MANYFKYNKDAQSSATPSNFTPFLQNIPKFQDGKEKRFNIPSDKSSDNNKFRILPPWSKEGLMAKVKKVHTYVGMSSNTIVCPETVEEGSCPFCNVAAKIRGDEKYKVDFDNVKDKIKAIFNVVDVNNPAAGCLLFETYSRIYFTVKKFQDSGEYGDITDILEGRDIKVSRTVHGKGKFEDAVYPGPNSTKLLNPDALDEIINLDVVFPEVDMNVVNKAFKSHPWKVYNPPVSVSMNGVGPVGKAVAALNEQVQEPVQKDDDLPDFKPPVEEVQTNKVSKLDDLERRLKEKMNARNAQ